MLAERGIIQIFFLLLPVFMREIVEPVVYVVFPVLDVIAQEIAVYRRITSPREALKEYLTF